MGRKLRVDPPRPTPHADPRPLLEARCSLAEAVVLLAAVSTATSERTLEPESGSVAVPEPEPEPEPKPVAVPIEAASEDRGGALEERPDPGPLLVDPEPRTLSDLGPPAPEAAEPSSPAWRGVARVEARVGAGALPRVDLGAAATLGLVHRWARIELTAAGWLPRERTVAPDARVRVSLWTGALRGCAALRPTSWVALLPCAGLELGSLRGEGRGDALEERRATGQPWVAIELTPAASFRLHRRVGLWLGASAIVPVRRLGFVLGGVPGDAFRVTPIVGRGALGLELHFW